MARIKEFSEIPLDSLDIAQGQSRTREVSSGISELADSIRKVGLLEPIVVVESETPGRFEILTGQRRFLAHRELGLETIWAAVLDQKVDETQAKVISVTENLVRKELGSKDLIDACTFLFNRYGTVAAVVEETGLKYSVVSQYVKYDRLMPELKQIVDSGEIKLATALKAQTAAEQLGGDIAEAAVVLAKEMTPMTNAQQSKLTQNLGHSTGEGLGEEIEQAKSGADVTQIIVTIYPELRNKLQQFAFDEDINQDGAALTLIEDGLDQRGYGGE